MPIIFKNIFLLLLENILPVWIWWISIYLYLYLYLQLLSIYIFGKRQLYMKYCKLLSISLNKILRQSFSWLQRVP